MSEIKVTRKDLFARIAETMSDDAEVVAMCEKYIAQLSAKREPKVKPEVEAFRAEVMNMMYAIGHPVSNKEMCEMWRADKGEMSAQKMSSALRWGVKAGLLERIEPATKKDPAFYTVVAAA